MQKPHIPKEEFTARIAKIVEKMEQDQIDAVFVYGDEYRKENLRYVSNYWPIFERAALLVLKDRPPILLCAPESERVAKAMSVWDDIRLLPDFLCVTVPDAIDYPLANFTSFAALGKELKSKYKLEKMGIVGILDMSKMLLDTIEEAFDCTVVDCADILYSLRLIKSENEIACIKQAGKIAEKGFLAMMNADLIGKTELYAAGIAEGVARQAGAEAVIFNVFGSGVRTAEIIGRPTEKIIENGDMIMCALAIQYEGYVATCELPFAVGDASRETEHIIDVLIRAGYAGLPYLKAGVPMNKFVKAVRDYFRSVNLEKYDVYPPLHGIGCAEAESPYPDERTEAVFQTGMTVNTDISLFGLEDGSNRIEEGFIITEDGAESIFPFMRKYYEEWIHSA